MPDGTTLKVTTEKDLLRDDKENRLYKTAMLRIRAEYNVLTRSFPTNLTAMVMGYKPKANFSVANEAAISAPPKVDFGK